MKSKQLNTHITYIKMAEIFAQQSYCVRKKVGSLMVKDNNIISSGYNGTPSGAENVCENIDGETHWYTLHSEANCISKIAKSTLSSDGAILYLTLSPCKDCSKLILQSGIKEIYYLVQHSCTEGLDFLTNNGVKCFYLKRENKTVKVHESLLFYERYALMQYGPNELYDINNNSDWNVLCESTETSINEIAIKEKLKIFIPKFTNNLIQDLEAQFPDFIFEIIEHNKYPKHSFNTEKHLFNVIENDYFFKIYHSHYKEINDFIINHYENLKILDDDFYLGDDKIKTKPHLIFKQSKKEIQEIYIPRIFPATIVSALNQVFSDEYKFTYLGKEHYPSPESKEPKRLFDIYNGKYYFRSGTYQEVNNFIVELFHQADLNIGRLELCSCEGLNKNLMEFYIKVNHDLPLKDIETTFGNQEIKLHEWQLPPYSLPSTIEPIQFGHTKELEPGIINNKQIILIPDILPHDLNLQLIYYAENNNIEIEFFKFTDKNNYNIESMKSKLFSIQGNKLYFALVKEFEGINNFIIDYYKTNKTIGTELIDKRELHPSNIYIKIIEKVEAAGVYGKTNNDNFIFQQMSRSSGPFEKEEILHLHNDKLPFFYLPEIFSKELCNDIIRKYDKKFNIIFNDCPVPVTHQQNKEKFISIFIKENSYMYKVNSDKTFYTKDINNIKSYLFQRIIEGNERLEVVKILKNKYIISKDNKTFDILRNNIMIPEKLFPLDLQYRLVLKFGEIFCFYDEITISTPHLISFENQSENKNLVNFIHEINTQPNSKSQFLFNVQSDYERDMLKLIKIRDFIKKAIFECSESSSFTIDTNNINLIYKTKS